LIDLVLSKKYRQQFFNGIIFITHYNYSVDPDIGKLHVQVGWGMISMVDAERRLLAKALEDIDNQHFVLLSDR
jgi:hypothetical protein